METMWAFSESQLGTALDAWAKTRRPNADTAQALNAISAFLNSSAALKLRIEPAVAVGADHG